ncbi:MAG: Ig-like domain-containing protein, partial [Chania sp.]
MVTRPAKLVLVDGKEVKQEVSLHAKNAGSPQKIKAIAHGKFILVDKETGLAPENITVKRVGKDLHVSLEGDSLDQPTVIIEDFFLNDTQLIGMAEGGAYYPYISSNGDDDNAVAAMLLDGESSPLVLGGEALSSSESHSILGALGILALGLGAIGAMVSQGRPGKHSGGGNHDEQPVVPDATLPTLSQVIDNQGAQQGAITAGSATDDNTPTFSGRDGTPGNTIVFYDNGKKLGETTVGQDGRWSFTPGESLDDGAHSVTMVEQNADGKVSSPSDAFEFVIDTLAPARPNIASIFDDVGSVTGALKPGATTDDTQPTLTGKAEAGAKIEIYDNGNKIGETIADLDGNWTFTPKSELAEGNHSFTTRATDAAGNVSVQSQPWELVIDTTAPDKPSTDGTGPGISEILDDQGAVKGTISNGGSTDDTQPTLKGEGEPGDTVIITDNGNKIGETTVDKDGKWEFTPEDEMGEGDHEIRVIIKDPAGNESTPSDPWVVIVDTTQPDSPVIDSINDSVGSKIGAIQQGEVTDDNRPVISGKAEAGSKVEIYDKGTKIGETKADTAGNWSFKPDSDLDLGDHAITVKATDAVGNVSEPSSAFDFTLITANGPNAPAIVAVLDDVGSIQGRLQKDAFTDDARPTLAGTSEPGTTVSIYSNGELLGSATTDPEGQWRFTPESDLPGGLNNLSAVAKDKEGNTSPQTGDYPLFIDTTPPATIESAELLDDVGNVQGAIANGTVTDDARPTFTGKAEAGSTVVIFDQGKEIGRVVSDSKSGEWSFTPDSALTDGEYSLTAQVIDRAGNKSEISEPIGFTVDTRQVEVSIDAVQDDFGVKRGTIAMNGVTDDATPTFSGRALPDSTVVIYDKGVQLGSVTSDAFGDWHFTPEIPMAEGNHEITATVIAAGAGESKATPVFDFNIDVTKPNKPGNDGETGIGNVIDDVGVVQGPIANGGRTDDTTPTFNGKGEPGDTIIILDNGNKIGEAPVDKDGNWTFTSPSLPEGKHDITVVIEDPAGNQSEPSDPWGVIVDTTPPVTPSIGSVYDNAGSKTGELQPGAATDDTTPTLKGQTEGFAKVEIFNKGTKIGETTAKEDGSWEFTPEVESALKAGDHSFTVRVTDTAGNVSALSQPWALVIDTTAPDKPSTDGSGPGISEILDDQGTVTGPISDGDRTDDTKPTLKGEGEPGDKIIITDNGNKIGETTVNEEGKWEFTPETDLSEERHEIRVIIEDPVGNQSEQSDPWVVIVDTTQPDVPSIGSVYDNAGEKIGELQSGDVTDDTTPTLKGQTEGFAKVEIFDKGEKIGETTAKEDGSWEFTPESLAEGDHSFTVRATDAVGNASALSQPWELEIGAAPIEQPSKPVIGAVIDDIGSVTGELVSGAVTDDSQPEISGSSDPYAKVIVYDRGIEIGRTEANDKGVWSFKPESDLQDGEYRFTAVAENGVGRQSVASDPFELIVNTGNGPTQIARVSQMGKDSGYDGNDFVTDNGNAGRLMHGTLSADLVAGQALQVSTDGGVNWFNALVDGTKWAAQDLNDHGANWNIQTRVVDQLGKAGIVMSHAVTLDIIASRAPASVSLEGTNLLVGFDPTNVVVGERIAVVANDGTQRFEHTLTA